MGENKINVFFFLCSRDAFLLSLSPSPSRLSHNYRLLTGTTGSWTGKKGWWTTRRRSEQQRGRPLPHQLWRTIVAPPPTPSPITPWILSRTTRTTQRSRPTRHTQTHWLPAQIAGPFSPNQVCPFFAAIMILYSSSNLPLFFSLINTEMIPECHKGTIAYPVAMGRRCCQSGTPSLLKISTCSAGRWTSLSQ